MEEEKHCQGLPFADIQRHLLTKLDVVLTAEDYSSHENHIPFSYLPHISKKNYQMIK
jgi:hypothetical protein